MTIQRAEPVLDSSPVATPDFHTVVATTTFPSGCCQGCGAHLPPSRNGPPRKWCSERCRRTQYMGTCVDCGAKTNGHNGPGKAAKRCLNCEQTRNEERNAEILRLWDAGYEEKQIARITGLTSGQVRGAVGTARLAGKNVSLHRARNRQYWLRIEQLWNEGRTIREIAADVGTTQASCAQQIQVMRTKGFDLPMRSGGGPGPHDSYAEHRALIECWWANGWEPGAIFEALGRPQAHPTRLISRLRSRGYDLPPRKTGPKPKVTA